MSSKQRRTRGGRFARSPGGAKQDASEQHTAGPTTEERLVAEVDRTGRELDRLEALKRRSPEQQRQVVALSRTQERLLYRLAQVRGETRRHARSNDVDADAAAHHPGEDHRRYLITRIRGYVDPARIFGRVKLPRCPGCPRQVVESGTFETPVPAEEVSR